MGWLEGADDIQSIKDFGNCVEVRKTSICYWVHPEEISWTAYTESDWHEGMSANCFSNIDEYRKGDPEDRWGIAVRKIAAELSKRSAKPSYSELEQELAKLKADYKELDDELEVTHQRHCQARKAMERYQAEMLDLKRDRDKLATNYQRECERAVKLQERVDKAEAENASLLEKFGPIDQAEQQAAEVETRFQKLAAKCERMAEILIELNEAIL